MVNLVLCLKTNSTLTDLLLDCDDISYKKKKKEDTEIDEKWQLTLLDQKESYH